MAVQRICDAMLPELARVFSTSLAQVAAVVSMFAVVYGLAQLFYGPLGDRLGKYRVLSWATLASSLGCGLSVFAPSLDSLVVARMLAALTAAAIIPLSLAWIGDHIAYEKRQETLARLGLGTTLGITVGQLAGGFLTDTLGWRWAFVFMTLLFAAVGLLLLADLRVQQARLSLLENSDPQVDGVRPGFVGQAWMIATAPWARIVLVVAFIEGAAGFGVLAIWAAHLHLHLDIGLSAAGAMVALFGLGGMLYMALARRMIARLGERGLALGGCFVLFLAAAMLAYSPWLLLAGPLCLLGGFGFFMFHNTMQANATQMSPTARGTAVSLFASCLFLGQSVGVLLAASLVERWGSQWVIASGGGVMALLGLYFSRALGRREQLMTV
jgi:MFS transporter, YNFM family, putative membrane transport protein